MKLTKEEQKSLDEKLPLKPHIRASVITMPTPGPKFTDKLYEDTYGIIVNAGKVANLNDADFLQARVEALVRHSDKLQRTVDYLKGKVANLIAENIELKETLKS